jgi:hypothetical protein
VTRLFYAVGFDDGGAGQVFIISRICGLAFGLMGSPLTIRLPVDFK